MQKETTPMMAPSPQAKEHAPSSFYVPVFGGGGKVPVRENIASAQFDDARDEDVLLSERYSSSLAEDFYPPGRTASDDGEHTPQRRTAFLATSPGVEEVYPSLPDLSTAPRTTAFTGHPAPPIGTATSHPTVDSYESSPPEKNKRSLAEQGITDQDVLFGRGGGTNNHAGNRAFRLLIEHNRPEYLLSKKAQKTQMAQSIVAEVRSKGGRWLKMDAATGQWQDVGDQAATRKASQALREGLAVKMRRTLIASGASESTVMAGVVKTSRTIPPSDHQVHKRQKVVRFEKE